MEMIEQIKYELKSIQEKVGELSNRLNQVKIEQKNCTLS